MAVPLFWRLLFLALLLHAGRAMALEAGWQSIRIAAATPEAPAITVALYYPTSVAPRSIPMGPFNPNVAPQTPPDATVKGLILLSHGTGGSELGHSSLAEALAREGYLVAAPRHPGDNWEDRSLLRGRIDRYLAERPRQASRVIDALLADPNWKDRIARDGRGPRIGAIGHSAGGYTVLALAGGEADVARLARHCLTARAEDPILCGLIPASMTAGEVGPVADPRVRAVVALSPFGAVFTAESLGRISVPVVVYTAELDRFLVPRFHGEWIAANLPGAVHRRVPNAWHFAFQDPPRIAIATEDGDLRADPPGFDRAAFLRQLARELPAFFDQALQ